MGGMRIAGFGAAAVLLGALSACTPVVHGVTGVSVDADGRASAEIVWCGTNRPDVVLLFADGDDKDELPWPGHEIAVPDDGQVPTTVPLSDLPPADVSLRMYGVDEDSEFTTESVSFTTAELATLPAGTVLVTEWRDERYVQRTVPREEFARLADGQC